MDNSCISARVSNLVSGKIIFGYLTIIKFLTCCCVPNSSKSVHAFSFHTPITAICSSSFGDIQIKSSFFQATMAHSTALHGSAPKYLCELCTLVADVASRIQLRSASQNILLVPRYKRSGLGRRAFSVAGPLVWNSIADCLRDSALELASFKRQLKTYLFDRY